MVCDVNSCKRILEASQHLCLHMKKDSFYSERTEDDTPVELEEGLKHIWVSVHLSVSRCVFSKRV